MSTPAKPPAVATKQPGNGAAALAEFQGLYDFPLDPYQVAACEALAAGRSVLVAAPTGAGKTVVGEFAVHQALTSGNRCFYTTPIKALSNQKFADLQQRYGPESVGLLTGDNSINGDAPIVVMTTEVLRNMLYAKSSALESLSHVVMDEVHYLANRERGAVWEEVLINLADSVAVAALSATVSNAEEFGRWLGTVRGHTDVIVEEHRPVPLWQHVLVGSHLHDLFVDDAQRQINPKLLQRAREEQRDTAHGGGRNRRRDGRGGRNGRGAQHVSRPAMVRRLEHADLLPAIDFIFSRAGCDGAVDQCMSAGIALTNEDERREILDFATNACATIDPDDLAALGYQDWLFALERGVAAHHAGLVPMFKEVVEALFQRGLVRMVFATETLALGINMPARSVVLERLVKWNGESHVDLTPGEYTQLTGRAGRRGIDVEGHAVVAWSDRLNPRSLAGLASTRTYPLHSSFRPSYNMAVNLVASTGRERAGKVLESSFAQFQANDSVVDAVEEIENNTEALAGYSESMVCDLGDFAEYAQLRDRLGSIEKDAARRKRSEKRDRIRQSFVELERGDVIVVSQGRRSGPMAVVKPAEEPIDDPKVVVVSLDGKVRRLVPGDVNHALVSAERIKIERDFSVRSANGRKAVAEQLRQVARNLPKSSVPKDPANSTDTEINELRTALRSHPCHGCEDREAHARWAERYHKLLRRNEKLTKQIDKRTGTITKQFNQICDLLLELGYLSEVDGNTQAAPEGALLARVYGEADLLTAEALRQGHWSKLTPAELASVCAALVYQSRGGREPVRPRLPRGNGEDAIAQLAQDWERLHDLESRHSLDTLQELDLGLCWPAFRWANGTGLDQVLWEAELTAGDFVRWCKQVIDLLGQIAQASQGSPISTTARAAAGLMDRGVVTYVGVHE
jgi:ATP-dependent RNA helicase HelY